MLHSVSDAQHVSGHRDVDAWHCAVLSRATAEAAAAREEEERGNAMKVRCANLDTLDTPPLRP